jgi:hypothetical protein
MVDYPVTITQMDAPDVRLDYGSANLIPEIFDNYKKLPGVSGFQRSLLEMKLLKEQPWRYLEYLKLKGIKGLINCFLIIMRDQSTSFLTKLFFPYIVLRAIFIRAIRELFKYF